MTERSRDALKVLAWLLPVIGVFGIATLPEEVAATIGAYLVLGIWLVVTLLIAKAMHLAERVAPPQRPSGIEWWRTKRAVAERDGWRCRRCRRRVVVYERGRTGPNAFHVDHIVPFSRGGSNHPSNLQTLCRTCNLRKGTRTVRY